MEINTDACWKIWDFNGPFLLMAPRATMESIGNLIL